MRTPPVSERFDWEEPPLDVYLSWPEKKQLEYCATRDEHSAQFETDPTLKTWYLWRAKQYRLRMEE